jgi:DNA polymerase-3 subunit delta'
MDPAVAHATHGGRYLTVGHRDALASIARAVHTERPPHALLLLGPRGVGKTTLALDLAAGLLCLADEAGERPCRACAGCRKVVAGNHPDLHRVVPEGAGEQVRLAQVQELAADLALTAMEGRFRIAIISAAHRLNPDAQNALLKTLEEPGPATCLVLCADDAAPLLPTVISRSARLRLAPLGVEPLTDWLVAEGHAEPSTARAAALAAGGRPGLALALTRRPEAVLARAGIGRTLLALLDADSRARLAAAAGLLADGLIVDAALRGEVAPSGARLQPAERRRALAVIVDAWRELGRDLAVAALEDPPGSAVRERDRLPELRPAAARLDLAALRAFLDRLDRLQLAVEAYASPELVLDVALLAWPRVLHGAPAGRRGRAA